MPPRPRGPRVRWIFLVFIMLAVPVLLEAQQKVSEELREQAKRLRADIQLLETSKEEFPSADAKSLVDSLDSEIASDTALLVKVNDNAEKAVSLEAEIQKLSSLKEKRKDQGTLEFHTTLDNEIQKRTQQLAQLANGATSKTAKDATKLTSDSSATDSPGLAGEKNQGSSAGTLGADPPQVEGAKNEKGAPSLDAVKVTPSQITGKATKNSQVKITADGKPIGQVEADKNGNFELSTANLRAGESITAVNSAGASKSVTAAVAKECSKDTEQYDCRSTFEATFYTGLSIDTFAADEFSRYHNFEDASKPKERLVGGFDFASRVAGKPKRQVSEEDGHSELSKENKSWLKNTQLWIYGETVHGVRSKDIDCSVAQNKSLPSCDFINGANPSGDLLFILRNATSLEAFTGLRWELLPLNKLTSAPASLYVGTEYGFLSVNGNGGNVVRESKLVSLGMVTTKGKFQDSYLEAAYGRSQLFVTNPRRRLKVEAFLTWDMFTTPLVKRFRPFIQMTVDKALGPGSDSVQTFLGFDFDLSNLVWGKASKTSSESE